MKETAKEDVIDVKWVFKPQIIDKRFVTYSYKYPGRMARIAWKLN